MGMALRAVYAVLGDFAIGADWSVCLYGCRWRVHIAELCEFLYEVVGDKHLYLFVGYCADYYHHLSAVGLSRSIYHGDGRLQDATGNGNAVYSADVD